MTKTLRDYQDSVLYFAKAALGDYGREMSTFEDFMLAAASDEYVTGWESHAWYENEDEACLAVNYIVYSDIFDDVCEFFETDSDEMLIEGACYVDSAIRLWVLETQVKDELKEYWDEF